MALVAVGTIYTDLDIGTIKGKPVDTDPLLFRQLRQWAIEPSKVIIHQVDPSVIVRAICPIHQRVRMSLEVIYNELVLHLNLYTLPFIVFCIWCWL